MAAKRSTRKTSRRPAKKTNGSLLPWVAVATVLAVVAYDHWSAIRPQLTALLPGTASHLLAQASLLPQMAASAPTRASVPAPLAKPAMAARSAEILPTPPMPIPAAIPIAMPVPAQVASATTSVSESFGLCGQGTHVNCVFDGSTFWVRGAKIRIADIETPPVGQVRCIEEERRANAAKLRLLSLLNAGPFTLQPGSPGDDADGVVHRRILRGGQSFGETLVGEGLARRRTDSPSSWCA